MIEELLADRRKSERIAELISAAEQLLAWQPLCSEGSSGDLRQKRMRAAIEAVRQEGKL